MAQRHPLDEKDVTHKYAARLQTLAQAWTRRWAASLEHSQKLMWLWASGYYDGGYSRWHLVNLMNRGVSAITSYMVEGNPRVLLEPLSPALSTFAYNLRLIVNFAIEQNNFAEEVLIPGATASMFGDAIARTFFEYDRSVSVDGEKIKVGTPRVAIIEPCDYIGDPSAKVRRDFAFDGDIYRLPTDYAKDLFAGKDKYGRQIADFINADCKLAQKYSAEEAAAPDFNYNRLSLDDYSTFIDIYNRREHTIDTIMPMGHTAIVLRSIPWDGPENGPYDVLGYRYLPNIPVSLPPAWDWYDMDVTMNVIAKAAREQAEAQKTVIGCEPAGKDAGKSVVNAKNMDVFTAKNLDKVKQFSFGGVTDANYSWLAWAEAEFQKSGTASSDILRGAGPSANTLGQDQLIYANASRIVNNFYTRFHQWETSILRKWVWAIFESPTSYFKVLNTLKIPGLGNWDYPVYFSSADKVGEFQDLVLKVIPYSTQRSSPEQKYQRLMSFMTQWLLPTMPLREGQGVTVDIEQADRLLADYAGMDEFPMWYRGVVPRQGPDVNFLMKRKGSGRDSAQMDDRMGSLEPSRQANLQQQQDRVGFAGEMTGGLDGQ